MQVIVVTQARLGSTRLPNKVLKKVKGQSLLQIHIDRIKQAKYINEIYIATTTKKEDNQIEDLAKQLKVNCYRGSENDVLDRFYQTIKGLKPDFVVRLTADCPLIDPILIDEIVKHTISAKLDYYTNNFEERYPDGQDIEVFTFKALEKAWKEAKLTSEKEHVTPYIRNNSSYKNGVLFSSDNHSVCKNYNCVRLAVDEQADFEVISRMINDLGTKKDWKTYAEYYLNKKDIKSINSKIIRNEGYLKSTNED